MPVNLKSLHRSPANLASLLESKTSTRPSPGAVQVASRLRKLGSRAPNGAPIEVLQILRIKKGDQVPKAFQDFPQLEGTVGVGGIASESYTDGWCQSHWNQSSDWENSWGECWDNSTSLVARSELDFVSIANPVRAFSLGEFSPMELRSIARFGVGR